MILYPTETLYALGVNALDPKELRKLDRLKGRGVDKKTSWLVRSIEDVEEYAIVSETARSIARQFLPGPMTLVLPVQDSISEEVLPADRTIGFRVSPDPIAQRLVARFMGEYNAPVTCTSANISGAPTLSTPEEILQQFGAKAKHITEIIDDGPRKGLASTVVRAIDDSIEVLREGDISESDIRNVVG